MSTADHRPADQDSRRGTLNVLFAAVALGLVFLVGAFAVALRGPAAGLALGEPAPPFELQTFDGRSITLDGLRGQVVVLNFWASWCVECEDEAPDLEALWQEHRDQGLMVLGVDYTDTDAAARRWIERFGLTYPNGPDLGGRISRRYGLTGVPETVIIDRQGRVVPLEIHGFDRSQAKVVGPIVPGAPFGPQDLRAVVRQLLPDASSG